jgi:hypothetical protein
MQNTETRLDNYGKPRAIYINGLRQMDDAALEKECERKIWLSSYATNNPRSDYHWQCDACYAECDRRGSVAIYERAYKAVERQVTGR